MPPHENHRTVIAVLAGVIAVLASAAGTSVFVVGSLTASPGHPVPVAPVVNLPAAPSVPAPVAAPAAKPPAATAPTLATVPTAPPVAAAPVAAVRPTLAVVRPTLAVAGPVLDVAVAAAAAAVTPAVAAVTTAPVAATPVPPAVTPADSLAAAMAAQAIAVRIVTQLPAEAVPAPSSSTPAVVVGPPCAAAQASGGSSDQAAGLKDSHLTGPRPDLRALAVRAAELAARARSAAVHAEATKPVSTPLEAVHGDHADGDKDDLGPAIAPKPDADQAGGHQGDAGRDKVGEAKSEVPDLSQPVAGPATTVAPVVSPPAGPGQTGHGDGKHADQGDGLSGPSAHH